MSMSNGLSRSRSRCSRKGEPITQWDTSLTGGHCRKSIKTFLPRQESCKTTSCCYLTDDILITFTPLSSLKLSLFPVSLLSPGNLYICEREEKWCPCPTVWRGSIENNNWDNWFSRKCYNNTWQIPPLLLHPPHSSLVWNCKNLSSGGPPLVASGAGHCGVNQSTVTRLPASNNKNKHRPLIHHTPGRLELHLLRDEEKLDIRSQAV